MEAVKAETEGDALSAWERLAVDGRLNARLRDLSQKLVASDGAWKADVLHVESGRLQVTPVVFAAPNRAFTSDAWKAALGADYAHLDRAKADDLRQLYDEVGVLNEAERDQEAATSRLAPLGYDLRLTPDGKLQMLQVVAAADAANSFMALVGGQLVQDAASLHLGFDARRIEAEKENVFRRQRAVRGACVTDPPLRLN